MTSDTFELNCPFCDKLYKLPREKVIKHVGKSIHCRRCGKPFSIPPIPPDEAVEENELAIPEPAVAFAPEPPSSPPSSAPAAPPSYEEAIGNESAGQDLHGSERLSWEPEHPEPPVVEQPVEEPANQAFADHPPFATGESFEPPALTEYSAYAEPPVEQVAVETPRETAFEHVHESAPPPLETLDEPPEASSYFAAALVSESPVPAVDDEPAATEPPEIEGVFTESHSSVASEPSDPSEWEDLPPEIPTQQRAISEQAISQEVTPREPVKIIELSREVTEGFEIEAPPPQLPPVPRPSPITPPKARRGARATVAPVFDAHPEEPEPRRRSRFGISRQPDVPVETSGAVPAESVETSFQSPTIESPTAPATPLESSIVESVVVKEADHEPPFDSGPIGQTEPVAVVESEAGDAGSSLPAKEDSPILANTAVPPMAVSENVLEIWLSIRRSVTLLAIMSVVIALILVAILLAMLGIIPKK